MEARAQLARVAAAEGLLAADEAIARARVAHARELARLKEHPCLTREELALLHFGAPVPLTIRKVSTMATPNKQPVNKPGAPVTPSPADGSPPTMEGIPLGSDGFVDFKAGVVYSAGAFGISEDGPAGQAFAAIADALGIDTSNGLDIQAIIDAGKELAKELKCKPVLAEIIAALKDQKAQLSSMQPLAAHAIARLTATERRRLAANGIDPVAYVSQKARARLSPREIAMCAELKVDPNAYAAKKRGAQ